MKMNTKSFIDVLNEYKQYKLKVKHLMFVFAFNDIKIPDDIDIESNVDIILEKYNEEDVSST